MENERKDQAREIACPFCHSDETELVALFGMQLMTSQYYCRVCHSVFEAVKWEEPGVGRRERKTG